VGYYNRFDVFQLTVDRSENRPIRFARDHGEGSRGGPEGQAASRGARGEEAPDREGPPASEVPRPPRR
jgi:hypothetical protein